MNIFNQYKGLRKELYILVFGRLVTAMGSFIWPLVTLILTKKLGYSTVFAAQVSIISTLLNIPFSFYGGRLADHYNKTTVIIICDLITVTCFIICSFIPLSLLTIVIFMIGGLFANAEHPSYEALIADLSTSNQRTKAYSLNYLGFNLGFILGPVIGSFLFKDYLNLAFFINGLATLSSTILIYLFVRNYKIVDDDKMSIYEEIETGSTKKVLKTRKPILFYFLLSSFSATLYGMISFFLPIYMSNLYPNNGVIYYGLLNSTNGLVVIIFTPILTRLFAAKDELYKFSVGVSLIALSALFYQTAFILPLAFLGMIVFTQGEVFDSLARSPYITRRIPSTHRGRIMSIYTLMQSFVGVSGQYLIATWIDSSSSGNIWFLIFAFGFVIGLLSLMLRKYDIKYFKELY